ncbi:MAG: hypothetical protein ACLR56_15200 [Oscillospiraceae bacterium]
MGFRGLFHSQIHNSCTAKGKSLFFEVFLLIGYACGRGERLYRLRAAARFIFYLSFFFYVLNFIEISQMWRFISGTKSWMKLPTELLRNDKTPHDNARSLIHTRGAHYPKSSGLL